MKAAAELTCALKCMVLQDAAMAKALAKFSDLFQKIAAAKADRTKAKEQRNHHRTHFNFHRAVPLPDKPCPIQGCRKLQQLMIVAYWEVVAD